jgi:hypothetical protein
MQESMGPIADRTQEHLLLNDAAIVQIRRLLLKALKDHAAGKPLPGMKAADYRVRSIRVEASSNEPFSETVKRHLRVQTPAAAE